MTSVAFVPIKEAKTALAGNLGIDSGWLETATAQYVVGAVGIVLLLWAIWAFFWPERREKPAKKAIRYDAHLAEAFAYAITGRWGRWISDMKSPETDRLLETAVRKFEQAAVDESVKVWGKPAHLPEHHFGHFTKLELIPASYWTKAQIEWDAIRDGYAAASAIHGLPERVHSMIELRCNRREVARLWPCRSPVKWIANLFRKEPHLDKGIPPATEPDWVSL